MKRIFAILAAVLLTSVCAMAQSNDATPLKGDVNGDGMVDVADIVAVIDVMEKGDAGYFYLGTTQPTAENYASLPGVVSTYTSITEANDSTINVTDGQTIYLLCPASWVEGKTVKLDDNDGNHINFSEDLETVSGYVVYTANGLSSSKTISLKVENTVVNYYWYIGTTQPTAVDNPSTWRTSDKDAGFNETISIGTGYTWFAYPDTWTYSAKDSSGDDFGFNAWVPAATKTSIPGYILLKGPNMAGGDNITITFSK